MSDFQKIFPATPANYAELVEVWEASVRATHDFLTDADIRFLKTLMAKDFLPMVSIAYVPDEQGAIAGFVGVADKKVEMLFIKPQSRGQGVGKTLLRYAVCELKADCVDVNEQNPSALGFYLKQGFEVIGRSSVDGMGKPFPLLHMKLANADF